MFPLFHLFECDDQKATEYLAMNYGQMAFASLWQSCSRISIFSNELFVVSMNDLDKILWM